MEVRYEKTNYMTTILDQYDATVLAYITTITDARTAYIDTLDNSDVGNMVDAEVALESTFSTFAVFLEDNPSYLGTSLYSLYMVEVTGSTNGVAYAKQQYNESVQAFNTLVQRFPTNLFIARFGFEYG